MDKTNKNDDFMADKTKQEDIFGNLDDSSNKNTNNESKQEDIFGNLDESNKNIVDETKQDSSNKNITN
jgi:hypothetical protein